MGARGPAPKPDKLKELAGNPGHRPLNKQAPQPKLATKWPKCPDWLPPRAAERWPWLCKQLEELGILHECDTAILVGYCSAWDEAAAATEEIEQHGRTFMTDKGYVCVHPAVSQLRTAWSGLVRFSQELGLSPSARSRVTVPKPDEEDGLDSFLQTKGA